MQKKTENIIGKVIEYSEKAYTNNSQLMEAMQKSSK